jgi:hypothetical protein
MVKTNTHYAGEKIYLLLPGRGRVSEEIPVTLNNEKNLVHYTK